MTCHEFQNRLSAYLDGELSRWCQWKVQNHLRYCPECAALMRDLSEVDTAFLLTARATAPPDYLTGSVMRRLPSMPPALPARRGIAPWAAGLAVACMQVLALGGAYWWGFMHGSGAGQAVRSAGSALSFSRPGGSAAGAPTGRGSVLPVSGPVSQPVINPGFLSRPSYRGVNSVDYFPQTVSQNSPAAKPSRALFPVRPLVPSGSH